MLKTLLQHAREAKPLALLAAMIGALCFVFSFALGWAVLRAQGNPAFLLIWLAAAIATMAFTRAHLKFHGSFERIHAMKVPMPVHFMAARTAWQLDVEDVAFREIPN